MRRFVFLVGSLTLVLLLAMPSTAYSQDRSRELARLGYLVGEWTLDAGDMGAGTFTCEWLGFGALTCDTEFTFQTGVTSKTVGVWRYDAERQLYTWLRYWGNGNLDDHVGWVDGDTWTWMQRDTPGGHYRFVMVEESPTEMSKRWWRSLRGEEWEFAGNATMTKIR